MNPAVKCFCFKCGNEWESHSSFDMECFCENPMTAYMRPCVEIDDRIDAAFRTESNQILSIEEICNVPMGEHVSTIFGINIPNNFALVARNIVDFEKNCVYLYDGQSIDIDSYYMLRDIGHSF